MPVLWHSGAVYVRLFADDHRPPHVHIWTSDGEIMVSLSDLSIIRGQCVLGTTSWPCFGFEATSRFCERNGRGEMADEFIVVGAPVPRIAGAAARDRRFAEITWADGSVQVIDFAPALNSHRAFIRLRGDDGLFKTMKVSSFGDSVVWDDGSELSAVWIRDLADGGLENADFRAAMDQLNMSLDGMAARLGIARRLVADYRKDKPIPKTVALAVKYLIEHQRKAG